jgi:hypothetical protein
LFELLIGNQNRKIEIEKENEADRKKIGKTDQPIKPRKPT